MTHHARAPKLRLLASAALAAGLLLGCSGSDLDDDEVISTLFVRATAASAVQGMDFDLRHGGGIQVSDLTPGASWTTATCQSNIGSGRIQAACVSSSDVSSPFTFMAIEVIHREEVDPRDEIDSIQCDAVNASGVDVVVVCSVD